MEVAGTDDGDVCVVLDLYELLDQIALVMIVSDAKHAHAVILAISVKHALDHLFAYEIADKLAAA